MHRAVLMEIASAVRAAESDPSVQEHIKEGFYLSSIVAIPETLSEIAQWTLVYFNPIAQKAFSVDVGNGHVRKSEASVPLVEGDYGKLDHKGALEAGKLLDKLSAIIAREKEIPSRVIITLRDGEWKIAVVTQSLKMIRVDLDMVTGKLKHIDKSPLVKPA